MLPQRKKLPHDVPPWVPDNSRYFITINCAKRGENQLATDAAARPLLDSILILERRERWYMHGLVIMPDHLHMIVTFPAGAIRSVIASWKGFHAKRHRIRWQEGFFEHRLRNDAEYTEKLCYVLQNPVRKGLVPDWTLWPYLYVRGDWAG